MGRCTYSTLDAEKLARDFSTASPFPHVVIDDFLVGDTTDLTVAFPGPDWAGWTTQFRDHYQAEKRACDDIEQIPGPLRDLIIELQSPAFLEFLEKVTGIDAVLPDPYLMGGGLHLSGPGGRLEPHSDFHTYPRLNLFRQINILVYLNPEWDESWGGCLDLFSDANATKRAKRVVPQLGRCVIFRTDDQSVHGFPDAITEGHWRQSIALYYYTAVDREGHVGDKYTYWRRHEEYTGINKARLQVHKGLVAAQGFVAKAAKAARPPQPKPVETPQARNR